MEDPQLPSGEQLMKENKKFQNVVACCSEQRAEGASTLIHLEAPQVLLKVSDVHYKENVLISSLSNVCTYTSDHYCHHTKILSSAL